MDLIDLFAREFQTRQIKSTGAWFVLFLLVLNTSAWIAILSVLNELLRAKQASFSGLQFLSFVAAFLLFLITNFLSKRKVVDLFEDLIFNIRYRLIQRMRKMELRSFEEVGSATFFNVMTMDLDYIADIAGVIWFLLSQAILISGILLYMAFLSPPVFAMILGILILGFLAFLVVQYIVIQEVEVTRNKEDSLFGLIDGLLFGFKEIKINRPKNEDFFQRGIKENILAVRDLRKKVGYVRGDAVILVQITFSVMLLFLVFVLPALNIVPPDVLFSLVAAAMLMPFIHLLNDVNYISLANISIDRISRFEERLRASSEDMPFPPQQQAGPQHITELAYKDFRFDYTDEAGEVTFSVGPMDLRFVCGEITFIVGGNGSGKSTLLKLLTGLYPALTGTVALDGEAVTPGEQREWFSCIFTDFHLFDRFYGLEDINEERVTELIRRMGLNHKVGYQKGGFSTLDLSTGQKKRLALIAALLTDKPFYIFDEWAADQSPEFREYFYNILLPELKARNKLIICVTHDDNYYHLADRIYKLELGKLVSLARTENDG
uniref:Putative ATP-binding cassette transporter n=1 Tax=Candidatus Kentrum sp. LPFa TaxID=2126335 RepID=A0A450WJX8_9GAMM|nr:MAG: putative ATP-binding cassette transporter [Candidatus Kentron sp. LPFa]